MSLYRKWQIFLEKSKGYTLLHYCSLTLAHAKGQSQMASTLPTIHFGRILLIFRGVWHNDILTGLAILIWRMVNKSRVVKTAGFLPPRAVTTSKPSTQLANCVYNISVKKTRWFYRLVPYHQQQYRIQATDRCNVELQSSQQNADDENPIEKNGPKGTSMALNRAEVLLQSTRFKHVETSSKTTH